MTDDEIVLGLQRFEISDSELARLLDDATARFRIAMTDMNPIVALLVIEKINAALQSEVPRMLAGKYSQRIQ